VAGLAEADPAETSPVSKPSANGFVATLTSTTAESQTVVGEDPLGVGVVDEYLPSSSVDWSDFGIPSGSKSCW
jgi:hypothetical protein